MKTTLPVKVATFLSAALLFGAFWTQPIAAQSADSLKSVNPLIGTDRGGSLPGAALPFSLVRLSPDTLKPTTSGYKSNQPIIGFSHTHLAQSGAAGYYGNIRVTPQTGPISVTDLASPKANEHPQPGYYDVTLTRSNVRAELTLTPRAGVHRYTFPAGETPRILIDLAAAVTTGSALKPSSVCTGAQATFVSDREITGQASFESDYAHFPHTVYFVAQFDAPITARGVWTDDQIAPGSIM